MSLEGQTQNWYNVTSATFVSVSHRPGLVQGRDREIFSISGWKNLQSHIAKGHGNREGNDGVIFVSNLPQAHFLTLQY